jgi:DNA processing protein
MGMKENMLEKIALAITPNIGPVVARNLVSYCGGVAEIWEAPSKFLQTIPGVGKAVIQNIKSRESLSLAEKQIVFMQKEHVDCIFYLDQEYPWRLKQIPDAPVLLFKKGDMNLNSGRHLAIVGTRLPTDHGKSTTIDFISEMKPFGVTVVSGLAYGIDITAHKECVKQNIPTIGVLGSSLDNIYPQAHERTAKKMMENGGIISEFPATTEPDHHNFPMRNRVIAGLADAVLVIESAEQGGSMITADLANQYNKDVFAIPGKINDKYSKGCNLLIKTNRAQLVEKAEEICATMGWEDKPVPVVQQSLFLEFDEEEKNILSLLNAVDPVSIDKLYNSLNYTPSKVASLLLNLEFKGAIRTIPGKRFILA